MSRRVKLIAPSFPTNYCLTEVQAFVNFLMSNGYGELPEGDDNFVISESEPEADDRDKIWVRLIDGALDRLYNYFNGEWVSPHPVAASSSRRELWVGSLVHLFAEDGGDNDPIGDASGPFWEEDTNFQGRSLMAPGVIPGVDPAKTLAVGENYGSGMITQTVEQMPEHRHTPNEEESDGFLGHTVPGAPATLNIGAGSDTIIMGETEPAGGGEPMNIVHPVRGIYVIKRTARVFYKAS